MKNNGVRENKKGYTLIELVVTFALIGIFMTAAIVTLTSFMRIYTRVSSVSRAQTVADMLTQTLVSELESAYDKGAGSVIIEAGAGSGTGSVSFENREGIPLKIYTNPDGYLILDYETVTDSSGTVVSEAVDWYYGEENYMGTKITQLGFEQVPDTNLIKLTLELTHQKTGYFYTTEKVFPCYNLRADDIQVQ